MRDDFDELLDRLRLLWGYGIAFLFALILILCVAFDRRLEEFSATQARIEKRLDTLNARFLPKPNEGPP